MGFNKVAYESIKRAREQMRRGDKFLSHEEVFNDDTSLDGGPNSNSFHNYEIAGTANPIPYCDYKGSL